MSYSENPFTKPKRDERRRNRNKFRANNTGFAKQGIHGRGFELDESQASYFNKILDVIGETVTKSYEDRASLADNVLETCNGFEVSYSSNQIACRVLECLLGYSSAERFEIFLAEFSKNLRPICSDEYASHILEKLVDTSFLRATANQQDEEISDQPPSKKIKEELNELHYNFTTEFTLEHRKCCSEFVIKVSKFLLNNLEDFVTDKAANYIIRSTILNLSGIKQITQSFGNFQKKKDRMGLQERRFKVPKEWIDILMEYAERLSQWPQFIDFPYEIETSALLQNLCIGVNIHNKKVFKQLAKKIIKKSFIKKMEEEHENELKLEVPSKLQPVFNTEASLRLLELLISLVGPKYFTLINSLLFSGNLIELSDMHSSNFAVQKLFEFCNDKTEYEDLFEEIESNFQTILKNGYTGIVSSIAEGCRRLNVKQSAFITSLEKALECYKIENLSNFFIFMVLKLKPYSVFKNDNSQFINFHGSTILQTMLKFNKPIKLIQNLLSIDKNKLTEIFNHSSGSYIANAFYEAPFVGEKSKEKFAKHLLGVYSKLSANKSGSRVVEIIYNSSNDDVKLQILTDLSKRVDLLESTMYGKIISSKYLVKLFISHRNAWKQKMLKHE